MARHEYEAARQGAALFDRSDAGKIVAAGTDRLAYLHAMLTQDVQALVPGTGAYAAYLTAQGRMISDMRVLELGDVALIDLPGSRVAAVLEKLDQFVFTEDVRLGDVSAAFGKLTLAGPRAPEIASRLAGGAEAFEGWAPHRNRRLEWRGQPIVAAAAGDLGLTALDFYVERPALGDLAAALAAEGAVPASAATADVLRVEAGIPAFLAEMDGDTLPLEAGIEARAISFTKGCYPGQEVVIRVVHRGHGRIARKLAGLVLDGKDVPAHGDLVRRGDREAGRVTSAVLSPALERPIAIAMLHRDFLEPGLELTVLHGTGALRATTAALPFRAPA